MLHQALRDCATARLPSCAEALRGIRARASRSGACGCGIGARHVKPAKHRGGQAPAPGRQGHAICPSARPDRPWPARIACKSRPLKTGSVGLPQKREMADLPYQPFRRSAARPSRARRRCQSAAAIRLSRPAPVPARPIPAKGGQIVEPDESSAPRLPQNRMPKTKGRGCARSPLRHLATKPQFASEQALATAA